MEPNFNPAQGHWSLPELCSKESYAQTQAQSRSWPSQTQTWLLTLTGLMNIGQWQGPVPVPSRTSTGCFRRMSCPALWAAPLQMLPDTQSGQPDISQAKFLLKHHLPFWLLLPPLTTEVSSRKLILSSVLSCSLPSWLWYTFLTMQHKADFPVVPNWGFNLCSGRSSRSYCLGTHTAEVCNNITGKGNVESSTEKNDKIEGRTVI